MNNSCVVEMIESETTGIQMDLSKLDRTLTLMKKYKVVYFYWWLRDRPESLVLNYFRNKPLLGDFERGIIEKAKDVPIVIRILAKLAHIHIYMVNGKYTLEYIKQKLGDCYY